MFANTLDGKWLKFIIGIAYIGLFTSTIATLLRYFSEALKLIYFPDTPIVLILAVFLLAGIIANKIGFRAIASINLVIVPLVLLSMLTIFFSTAKSFTFEQFFPIFGNGVNKTFFSGLSNIFAFGGIAFLYFLLPLLKSTKNVKRIFLTSIIISGIYLLISVSSLLLVFSFAEDTNLMMPIYTLTRHIEFGKFLQRTDALFVLLWILSFFSYLSICISFSLITFKKISNITNPKAIVYSISMLIFGLSLVSTNISIPRFFQQKIYPYYELILVFGISMAILIWGNVKYRVSKKQHKLGGA